MRHPSHLRARISPRRKLHKMAKLRELRTKRKSKMAAMRHIERTIPKPMIASRKGDDARLLRHKRSRLQGCFHSFEPRVAEDRLAGSATFGPALVRDSAQLARQLCFEPVWVDIAHRMEQPLHLPLSRTDNASVAMPGCGNPKGSRQIQIPLPVRVPYMNAPRPLPHNWPGIIRFKKGDVA